MAPAPGARDARDRRTSRRCRETARDMRRTPPARTGAARAAAGACPPPTSGRGAPWLVPWRRAAFATRILPWFAHRLTTCWLRPVFMEYTLHGVLLRARPRAWQQY